MLVRQRIGAIGREATDRVRAEMKVLGRAIAESKEKGSGMEGVRDEERRRCLKSQKSSLKPERGRSV